MVTISWDWGLPLKRNIYLKVNKIPCIPITSSSSVMCMMSYDDVIEKGTPSDGEIAVDMMIGSGNNYVSYKARIQVDGR